MSMPADSAHQTTQESGEQITKKLNIRREIASSAQFGIVWHRQLSCYSIEEIICDTTMSISADLAQ